MAHKPFRPWHLPAGWTTNRHLARLLALRVWLHEKLHPKEGRNLLFWAGVVGILGGLSSVGFRYMIDLVHFLLTNQTGGIVESFSNLSRWQRLLIPFIGGAIAGFVILFGKKLGRSPNTTDYMEAVVLGDGMVSFRSSIVKCASSLFSVASGGSIGREGPMVQLSALLASLTGRWHSWSVPERRLLVACGASAGIASVYNAPIAGALFVAEIILGTISMETFGPLVLSSVLATQVSRYLRGDTPLYGIPVFRLNSGWELFFYLFLGVLAGVIAPMFLKALRSSERLFAQLGLPVYLRLALGGLIVGMLAVFHPEVCGNGYSVVNSILNQKYLWGSLALVLVLKVIATCATFGSGAVGGVFTPTLFVGASLGYLFGVFCHALPLGGQVSPGAFALVGMGTFLAATTHAPLMAIMMVFEMTLDYQIILPLMLGSVFAYYTSTSIHPPSIYTASLEKKGATYFANKMASLTTSDLIKTNPLTVRETARFGEIARNFIANTFRYLYVVDEKGVYLGAIYLHDIKEYLNSPELANLVIAGEIMCKDLTTVFASDSLRDVMNKFATHEGDRLPVITQGKPPRLLGSISKTDLILALGQIGKPGSEEAKQKETG